MRQRQRDEPDSKFSNSTHFWQHIMEKSDNHPSHPAADQNIRQIRPLKKEDGEPLWRKDIQYDFLRAVFDDECKVFTNSYDITQREKQTFARLYIDAMARSSKTSKVLGDKLLNDWEAAKSMAMVCLLVNIGRINTTLNCKSSSSSPFTPPTACILLLSPLYTTSLSRDASPASHLPCHPLYPGLSGHHCIQTTAGCSSPKNYPQGRSRKRTWASQSL